MVRIFEIDENKTIHLTENVLLIPQLAKLVEKYKANPMPVLQFVYFMAAPDSPYSYLPEDEKEAYVAADCKEQYGLNVDLDDPDIFEAVNKLEELYQTPTSRIYKAAKINLEKMIKSLSDEELTFGKDGNADYMYKMQTGLAKIMENFKKLEKMKDEEQKVALRGKAREGMR